MIVESLMQVVYTIFSLLTVAIRIPGLPDGMEEFLQWTMYYVGTGAQIFAAYTDFGYLVTLFVVVLAVDAGLLVYKFIMWVLKKIPMLGIE